MTRRELSQLYHLNREIEQLTRQLQELESRAESTTAALTGLPRGSGVGDQVGRGACEIAIIQDTLETLQARCWVEYRKLTEYISGIGDSLIRQIMTLRHVNGLSWAQVAACIGGDNTPDSVRMAHNRYLSRGG